MISRPSEPKLADRQKKAKNTIRPALTDGGSKHCIDILNDNLRIHHIFGPITLSILIEEYAHIMGIRHS